MTIEPPLLPTDVAVVRDRRATLRRACRELARQAGAGITGPADRVALTRALDDLAERWDRHVVETEAPRGLLDQVVADAPRLATTVARLRADHSAVCDLITEARSRLADLPREPPVELPVEPPEELPDDTSDDVARRLRALLDAVERHARAGGELLYRAYNVDIGLGE